MKRPDEIKKGLPMYTPEEIKEILQQKWTIHLQEKLYRSALAYIQQLERERDAAVELLKEEMGCRACAKYTFTENYVSTDCLDCINECNWVWRGVKEE